MNLLLSPEIDVKVTSMTCFLVVLALDMIVEQIIMKLIILDEYKKGICLTTTTWD